MRWRQISECLCHIKDLLAMMRSHLGQLGVYPCLWRSRWRMYSRWMFTSVFFALNQVWFSLIWIYFTCIFSFRDGFEFCFIRREEFAQFSKFSRWRRGGLHVSRWNRKSEGFCACQFRIKYVTPWEHQYTNAYTYTIKRIWDRELAQFRKSHGTRIIRTMKKGIILSRRSLTEFFSYSIRLL